MSSNGVTLRDLRQEPGQAHRFQNRFAQQKQTAQKVNEIQKHRVSPIVHELSSVIGEDIFSEKVKVCCCSLSHGQIAASVFAALALQIAIIIICHYYFGGFQIQR